ncbi:MAG: hypothetical protein JJU36_06440 [Phycisphaeraceae bacterium]|nr:hypothetical protein [Phycisphaeraceae bacterium]
MTGNASIFNESRGPDAHRRALPRQRPALFWVLPRQADAQGNWSFDPATLNSSDEWIHPGYGPDDGHLAKALDPFGFAIADEPALAMLMPLADGTPRPILLPLERAIVKADDQDQAPASLEDKLLAGDHVQLQIVESHGQRKLRIDAAGPGDPTMPDADETWISLVADPGIITHIGPDEPTQTDDPIVAISLIDDTVLRIQARSTRFDARGHRHSGIDTDDPYGDLDIDLAPAINSMLADQPATNSVSFDAWIDVDAQTPADLAMVLDDRDWRGVAVRAAIGSGIGDPASLDDGTITAWDQAMGLIIHAGMNQQAGQVEISPQVGQRFKLVIDCADDGVLKLIRTEATLQQRQQVRVLVRSSLTPRTTPTHTMGGS